jgi:hypothetical protein
VAGSGEHGNETSGSIKGGKVFDWFTLPALPVIQHKQLKRVHYS